MNTKDTPTRQPSFYRSPSNDYEEGYRDAKKEMDALKLELQKQKELNAELVNWIRYARDLMKINVPSSQSKKYVGWIECRDILESLIKKSNEI